jgi:two-component system sensor histidine kinase KdpD
VEKAFDPKPVIIDPEVFFKFSQIISQSSDWKTALEQVAGLVHTFFIYDNLVVYSTDPNSDDLEVIYAKAAGRGKTAEADIAWGELIANQVYEQNKILFQNPNEEIQDRLHRPYLMGLPINVSSNIIGVLVFIRFGGPAFPDEEKITANFISQQAAILLQRRKLEKAYTLIETQERRYQLQDDFLSTVSHEVRNPLGFIKGYTTTLLRKDTTWDAETTREFLEIIDQETDHLRILIENVLDSARLQSGQMPMNFEISRLDMLINNVITRARKHHPNMEIKLLIEGGLSPIKADPNRLTQVFENIISNAAKYAPESDILIKIKQDEHGSNIDLEDHGPGIPAEYLEMVFERFFRNPEQAPGIHGSGLGLYICKEIIQAHKGTITATSEIGEGTTFHMFLPYQF